MKNFQMPEFISSTLEADELKRLYESIKSVVSEEVAENIINEIPIARNWEKTHSASNFRSTNK